MNALSEAEARLQFANWAVSTDRQQWQPKVMMSLRTVQANGEPARKQR